MFEAVVEKLTQYSEYPKEQITKDTNIISDLNIDSLNIMVIIGDYEEEYGIHIEAEDIQNVVTVGEFVEVLEKKINEKGSL